MSFSSFYLQSIKIYKKFFKAVKKIVEKWDPLKTVNLCTKFNLMKNHQKYFFGFKINFFG